MNNRRLLDITFFWYIIPFLYLFFVKNAFPINVTIVLFIYFSVAYFSYFIFSNYEIRSNFNFRSNFFIKGLYFLMFIIQLIAIYRMIRDVNLMTYRNNVFEDSEFLFGSTYLYTLYNIFLFPLVICSIVYTLANNITDKISKKYVLYGFLLLILDSVIKLGRFPILYILYFVCIYPKFFNFTKKKIFIGGCVFFLISQIIMFYRYFYSDAAASINDVFSFKVLEETIINYQIIGYVIFEELTREVPLWGEPISFNSFAFFFFLIKTFATKFSGNITYGWEEKNLILSEGFDSKILEGQFANAFSTNFYPLFLDLGILGIIIFAIYSGFVFGIKSKDMFSKFQKHLLLFVMIFGIYQPIILTLFGVIVSPLMLVLSRIKNLNN